MLAYVYIYVLLVNIQSISHWYVLLDTPAITTHVMDQARNKGDAVSFTCEAIGEPIPRINWYFKGILVQNNPKYMISRNNSINIISSTLMVQSVESSDAGTYTCKATNVVSTNSSSGVLTVNGGLL